MVKLIVFDLDGVLVDAKKIHFNALNRALSEVNPAYVISYQEHLKLFDGIPTRKKLLMLTEMKGLRESQYKYIAERKQFFTIKAFSRLDKDLQKIKLFLMLKNMGFTLVVASNSVRSTVEIALSRIGVTPYVDHILSNEDVAHPKPHPEIYLKAMVLAGVTPQETLILEDSVTGKEAAKLSGAYICAINQVSDVVENKITRLIRKINMENNTIPWEDKDLNVLIPMAGAGSRFEQAGYTFPKPLIEVANLRKPMIQVVVENLNVNANFTYIVQKAHYDKYSLKHLLELITPGCNIVVTDGLTEGAACTTLLAKDYINNRHPLLIANSDQFVEWSSSDFMYNMAGNEADAGMVTFNATHPKWSFAEVTQYNRVKRVAEKQPISDVATVGIYWFRQGCDYVRGAQKMIAKNIRTNNEFYVCPVFNELIEEGLKVQSYHIEKNWGLGTPEDLNYFIENYVK